jgi:uncharacterized protein YndB with AHSA1/START domain
MSASDALALRLDAVLPAPRELVFAMLTTAPQLARWWGPRGFTTPAITLDLGVGGGYRFTMQPPEGDRFHVSGDFLAVAPPRRLVYTFRHEEPAPDDRVTVVTLSLGDREGMTHLALSQGTFATQERLDRHRTWWTESLERLREVLAAPA